MTDLEEPTLSHPTTDVDVLDLSTAKKIVAEMLAQIDWLDGQMPPPNKGPASGDTAAELLNVSDQLMLAAGLVRNTYWNWKGRYAYDL